MNELYVIETEDDAFLGQIRWTEDGLTIYTGYRGHPKQLSRDEVVRVTPARSHPDVEYIKAV